MRIFVGCSSKEEIDEKYKVVATRMSHLLCSYDIVIGGTFMGLMKLVSRSISKEQITQVCLKDYLKNEEDLTNFIVCDTSFERLQKIWELSDCFLLLPGGTGTLSEFFSFFEENRTKSKKKKIYLLNYDGFYDEILFFLQSLEKEKFCDESFMEDVFVVKTPEEFIELLKKEV